jgi:outer membrane usher protein
VQAAFVLVALAVVPAAAQDQAAQRALLSLSVNGVESGEALVVLRAGDVLADVAALQAAGMRGFAGRREMLDDREFVSLGSLAPDLRFTVDERALTLSLIVSPAWLGTTVLDLRPPRPSFEYRHQASLFVNYGANWVRSSGADAAFEAGLSWGPGLLLNTMSWDSLRGYVRGQTSMTVDQPSRLRRWTIGDTVVSARTLSSGLLVAGVRVQREYSLDPYFVQFPSLALAGTVLTPSTVEVYVNNRLVSRDQVSPGAYKVTNLPIISGSNNTRVVVRDAFGREQQSAAPYYLATTALARGLHEYDYGIGSPRVAVAGGNWSYGSLAGFAHHRYGFTDRVTAGFVAEGSAATFMGGPTLNLRLRVGEVEFTLAGSRSAGETGGAGSLGYSYATRRFTVGGNVRAMSDAFGTLTVSRPGDRSRAEGILFVGTQLGSRTSLSVQQAYVDPYAGAPSSRTALLASARVTRRTTAFVNANTARTDAGARRYDVSIGLSVSLADRTTGNFWLEQRGSGKPALTADLDRALTTSTSYGYRLSAVAGDDPRAEGVLLGQTPYGRYEVAQEFTDTNRDVRATANGGVVLIGGGLHPTRPVVDSYALVKVPDVPGVRTYLNNQEMGRTNRRGELLVSNMLPYYANRLAIADQDVPMDRAIDRVEQGVAPPYRGGAVVTFGAVPVQAITGTAAVSTGGQEVLPAYGQLSVSAKGHTFESPIGAQGEFYLENVPPGRHPAVILFKGQPCQFTIEIPASASPVLQVGVARCVAEAVVR